MDYICKHCKTNLDDGDILEYFVLEYGNYTKALEVANKYGWSETNKLHFTWVITIQPDNSSQYNICPECNQNEPLS
jgi:hypothetical protein